MMSYPRPIMNFSSKLPSREKKVGRTPEKYQIQWTKREWALAIAFQSGKREKNSFPLPEKSEKTWNQGVTWQLPSPIVGTLSNWSSAKRESSLWDGVSCFDWRSAGTACLLNCSSCLVAICWGSSPVRTSIGFRLGLRDSGSNFDSIKHLQIGDTDVHSGIRKDSLRPCLSLSKASRRLIEVGMSK